MAQIAAQWLRGSDLEMVLARDLSSMARWLGSISAHENRIKKYIPHFFFFLNFEIQNSIFFSFFFFFFSYWTMPVFSSFFFFFSFFFFGNITNNEK
jgi:hypothetical protein